MLAAGRGGSSHSIILYKAQWVGSNKDKHHDPEGHGPSRNTSDTGSPKGKSYLLKSQETWRSSQILKYSLSKLKQKYRNAEV